MRCVYGLGIRGIRVIGIAVLVWGCGFFYQRVKGYTG